VIPDGLFDLGVGFHSYEELSTFLPSLRTSPKPGRLERFAFLELVGAGRAFVATATLTTDGHHHRKRINPMQHLPKAMGTVSSSSKAM
jgi:hypothetical protein